MQKKIYTQAVEDELLDIQRGLHLVMTKLIEDKDYDEAKRIIRQVDDRMTHLINQTQIAR